MEDVKNLSEKLGFPVYEIGEEVNEPGVLVHERHCVCLLPKTDRHEMIAREL